MYICSTQHPKTFAFLQLPDSPCWIVYKHVNWTAGNELPSLGESVQGTKGVASCNAAKDKAK